MNIVEILTLVSTLLLTVTFFLIWRMTKITGWSGPWILFFVAFGLTVFRRLLPFFFDMANNLTLQIIDASILIAVTGLIALAFFTLCKLFRRYLRKG